MSSPLVKRLSLLLSVLSVLAVFAVGVAGWFHHRLSLSLPALDGEARVPGLGAAVKVERDALGVPTVSGAGRADVARALGYLHAQDRFFQMDLLRRRASGELAELFGKNAVSLDKAARLHGFRAIAEQVVSRASPAERIMLDAYVAGVNAGLAALRAKPWEYLVLRTEPAPWRAEDTVLAICSLWLDLQDHRGNYEQSLRALQFSLGSAGLGFFAPLGSAWDAALDGSTFPAEPIPQLKLVRPANVSGAAVSSSDSGSSPFGAVADFPGSNSMAVAGAQAHGGAALVASDMHLGLAVPNVWYRAALAWTDAAGSHRLTGVTLPGTPFVLAGSNGSVAWGFTNAQVDTVDVVVVQSDNTVQALYRNNSELGWVDIAKRTETIRVRNASPVEFVVRSTEWGPIVSGPDEKNCFYALHWTAHDPAATDFGFFAMETAGTVEAAVDVAHRSGLPNQNLIVADTTGAVAWTIAGKVPRRVGFDGRLPVTWSYGDRKWDGWVPPGQIPVVRTPADGLLWTANNRIVGGAALALLGDGAYDPGARGGQIRDDLRALAASGKKITPNDLLGVQLDDRAAFLERWQKLLIDSLPDTAVARQSARAGLRNAVRLWNGRAAADSVAYRLVRAWRTRVAELALGPLFGEAVARFPEFGYTRMHYEDALWRLLAERPAGLLDPRYPTWDALLLAAADDVCKEVDRSGAALTRFTWGERNTLKMQHPFSRFIPGVFARFLDMPVAQLSGDANMPRVQAPAFGASERMVVSPGREAEGLFHMPGGQSGHPLSPYYRAGHEAWVRGEPTPFLPGPAQHTLVLKP